MRKKLKKKILQRRDLLVLLGAKDVALAEQIVYKHTACGAWLKFFAGGVRFGSLVEGCEFGTVIYKLEYPFTHLDFYGLLEEVEKEAEALWKWANEGLGGEAPSCYNPVFEKYYDGRC
jgi:hypothetical protein